MAKGAGKAAQKKRSKSDFAKVRHKVGRKVPQAVNATNTTVKAKRLVLAGALLLAAWRRCAQSACALLAHTRALCVAQPRHAGP